MKLTVCFGKTVAGFSNLSSLFNSFLNGLSRWFLGIILFLFLIIGTYAHAQTGGIRGVVFDATNNETLVGAAVVIQGTYVGVTTDFDGQYRLEALQPGTYSLQFSFISYDPVIIDNIKVESGRTVTLNVPLSSATQQLQGVSVVARRVQHTDVSLISSIKTADLVVSGVSAQQISRSQDRDASQVVRRIPGVTIIDNRFIVVRGLNERYNVVFLNDILAPSMEDDVRSFSFDVIPSGQLERILIYKSPSADLPGDFAGGVIKVYTKSIPDNNGIDFSYTVGYEPGTTLKDFYGSVRYSGHSTGFNTGGYDLPKGTPSDIRSIRNETQLQELGRSFKNDWVPDKNTALFNQSASLTGYFKQPIGSTTLGHFTSVNYSNSYSFAEVDRYDYNAYDLTNDRALPIYWYNDFRYKQTVKVGALHDYGYVINPFHSIEIKNLFNQIGDYFYVDRGGDHYDFGFIPSIHGFQQLYRTIYSGQLGGKHAFFDKLTEVSWTGGYGFTKRDMPDMKRYRSDLEEEGRDRSNAVIYVPIGGAQPYFLGRFYSEMDETTYSGALNITQNIRLKDKTWFRPVIKAGIYYDEKERGFVARNIGYTQAVNFDQNLRWLSIDQLMSAENINNNGGIKIDEQSNPNDSYDATSKYMAYYVSATIPLTREVKLVAGVRVEDYTQTMKSATTGGLVDMLYQSTDYLPSFNLSWSFNEQMLIRAAYGKTINRPEFRERAPFSFYDFNNNLNRIGNQFLQDASILNYDLRWEWYPTVSEMVNFGAFYKDFSNPIEVTFSPGAGSGGAKNFTWTNAEQAYVYGLEFDARKSLYGMFNSGLLDNFSVLLNAALIKSNVTYGEGFGHGRDIENRPLQGQSPYVVNTGLYYSNDETKWEGNIQYNIIGPRIYAPGFTELDPTQVAYGNVWEMQRNQIDLTVSKTFKNNLNLKFGITDLLNEKARFVQDVYNNNTPDKKSDPVMETYRPGTLFTFSIGIKL
jgi:outer membrane receptor for ferrienterochelin and colicin